MMSKKYVLTDGRWGDPETGEVLPSDIATPYVALKKTMDALEDYRSELMQVEQEIAQAFPRRNELLALINACNTRVESLKDELDGTVTLYAYYLAEQFERINPVPVKFSGISTTLSKRKVIPTDAKELKEWCARMYPLYPAAFKLTPLVSALPETPLHEDDYKVETYLKVTINPANVEFVEYLEGDEDGSDK
jgi:hypothetical protein